MTALAKNPQQRYQTAHEMGEALNQVLSIVNNPTQAALGSYYGQSCRRTIYTGTFLAVNGAAIYPSTANTTHTNASR